MNLFNRNHSNIFRMNGFTALTNAKDSQNCSYVEIAVMIAEKADTVAKCFFLGYQKVNWKVILKVAEVLGVSRRCYIKEEFVGNLPAEVSEFHETLIGASVTFPQKEKLTREELTAKMLELFKAKKSNKEIEQETGLPQKSISYYRTKLGYNLINRKPKSNGIRAKRRAKVLRMFKEGADNDAIKAEMGFSDTAISHWRTKLGYNKNKKRVIGQPKKAKSINKVPQQEPVFTQPLPSVEMPIEADLPATSTEPPSNPNQWAVDVLLGLDAIKVLTIHTEAQEIIIKLK